jgi:hypothetical protein
MTESTIDGDQQHPNAKIRNVITVGSINIGNTLITSPETQYTKKVNTSRPADHPNILSILDSRNIVNSRTVWDTTVGVWHQHDLAIEGLSQDKSGIGKTSLAKY